MNLALCETFLKRIFLEVLGLGLLAPSKRFVAVHPVDIYCGVVLVCFPLRTVAFRGHGFSLLEKTTLRGLQTRAVPAGVNGPPLQTNIIIVKASYAVLLPKTMLAKEIHEDS